MASYCFAERSEVAVIYSSESGSRRDFELLEEAMARSDSSLECPKKAVRSLEIVSPGKSIVRVGNGIDIASRR